MTLPIYAAIITFELNEHRYGLPLADVCEVLALPTIVPLPKAPMIVEGVINLRGTVVPVMDIRRRFGLPAKAPHPADHLLVAWARARRVALRVDRVVDLQPVDPSDIDEADAISPRAEYLVGVARQRNGLVLLHDLGSFLADAEESELDMALDALPPVPA